jgi:hypothetical protein
MMSVRQRLWTTLWRFPFLLIAGQALGGCEDSCDEEAECGTAPFSGCRNDRCGVYSCLASATFGHVICNDDGTQGCIAWPLVAAGCETMGSPEQQAGCTELLLMVLSETTGAHATACRDAVLELAPCALAQSGTCDFAAVDAACFDDVVDCE